MSEQNINTNITATANFAGLTAQLNAVTASLIKLQETTLGLNTKLNNQFGAINKAFADTMRSTGQFSTHFVNLTSDVQKFGQNLDSGRMKLGDYYKTWQGHAKKTSSLVTDLAKQQVRLENAILQPLGRNAQGLMQYNVHVATGINEIANKTAIARQEMSIMNKVMLDGSNRLVDWGKNTQWAGRQLTVGLTVPLAAFGAAASKAFREADAELVRLTKVYGGLSATSASELKKVRSDVSAAAKEMSAQYGTVYKDTIALAADIAATGKQGNDLIASTKETTRLAVLGEIDRQEAMKATLSIQNTFKQSTKELSGSIDFLNAVENQTSTSLQDLVEAIPKAGPVIQSMGGSVKDLALYLTAMKEGGIDATSGANALKSALASLINPTKVAKDMFKGFGIDLSGIVTRNAGNLTGTIMELQAALDKLDPLKKQQAIEQLFGKFQFARMNALFANLGKQGSQTLQVLDLMKASTSDLSAISQREIKQMTESVSGKYKRALESVKADLAQVGEQFTKIGTFVLNTIDGIVKFVNKLPGPIKSILSLIGGLTAIAGPLIMLTGVLGNFFGYMVKGIFHLKQLFKGGEGFKLLTPEIMAAAKAGTLVEESFYSDAKAAMTLSDAISTLASSFQVLQDKALTASVAVSSGISTMAGSPVVGPAGAAAQAQRVADKNNPLIGKPYARHFAHLVPSGTEQPGTIFGVVPNPAPVNQRIGQAPQMYMSGDLPKVNGVSAVNGVSTGIVAEEAAKWHSMTAALATQSEAELKQLKTQVAATGTVTNELAGVYQQMLPQMTELTKLAASESASIVEQLQAGKLTVDQARAKIIALNAEVETMMAQTAQQVAAGMGRNINLTTVPLTSQPVVDPVTKKSNMKEMFHKGETRKLTDTIASILGVRSSGGGYSIETTVPKRLNSGGAVYDPEKHGNVVPGDTSINYDNTPAKLREGGFILNQAASRNNPELVQLAKNTFNSGGQVVDALLTPGETYFPPELAQQIMPTLEKANSGSRIKLRGGGGSLTSRIVRSLFTSDILKYRKKLAQLAEQRNISRAVARDRDFQVVGRHGQSMWMTRGSGVAAAIDSYIKNLPTKAEQEKAAKIFEDFSASIYTGRGGIATGSARDTFAIEAGYLEPGGAIDKLLTNKENGLPALNLDTITHATHLTKALVKNGQRLVSRYTVDYDARSNLQANHGTLLVKNFLDRNMGRAGKYNRLMTKAGIPADKWLDVEKVIDQRIKDFLAGKESKMMGDEKGHIHLESLIPIIDEAITSFGGSQAQLDALKKNTVLRKNSGGKIGGQVRNGKANYGYKPPIWALAGNTAKNMFRGEYKSPLHLTKEYEAYLKQQHAAYWEKLPKDANGNVWFTPDQLRLQREGKSRPFTNPQPKRYYQDLSNNDPAHGTLHIARYQPEMHVRSQYVGPQLRWRDNNNWRATDGFSRPALPLGTLEDRAKASLFRYMQGDYQAIADKEVQTYLSSIRSKFTGTLHRGVNFRVTDSLPPFIKKLIADKNWDELVGKEFIMRRASWSKNPNTAKGFGHNYNGNLSDQVILTASVKNRNAVPASEIFPGLTFQTPKGPVAVNENEVYMGGKFRIVAAGNNKLKLEAVVDGARENGGPVNAGRPYLVGEKGPELFVPRNSGGIIPHYALGGAVKSGQHNYGKLGTIGTKIGAFALPMVGGQLASTLVSKTGIPDPMGLTSMAAWMGGAAVTNKAISSFGKTAAEAAAETGKFGTVMAELNIAGKAIPGWGKVAAIALTAVAAASYGAWEKARKARLASQEALKFTKAEADQLGVTYTSLTDKIKTATEAAEKQKKLTLLKAGGSSAIGGGISMSAKELAALQKQAKATQGDLVQLFNNLNANDVVKAATDLKVQLVAAGKSAAQAAKEIYSIISVSNKASQAQDAVTSQTFLGIIDKASAAKQSVDTFYSAAATGAGTDAKEIAASFNGSVDAIQSYYTSLVGVKDATGHVTTQTEALAKVTAELTNNGKANEAIGQNQMAILMQQNPLYRDILKSSDSLIDAWTKIQLYTNGVTADLTKISGKEAAGILQVLNDVNLAAKDMTTNLTSAKDSNNPLRFIADLGTAAKKAMDDAATASKNATVNAQKNADAEIKAIDAKIAKIREEADARIKAIDATAAKEDYLASIKKQQIDAQQMMLAGNTAGAAQAQLNIQQLTQQYQKQLAINAINDKAAADTKKLEEDKAKVQERIAALQAKAVKLQEEANKRAKEYADIQALQSSIATTLAKAASTTDPAQIKILAAALKSDISALSQLGTAGAKAAKSVTAGVPTTPGGYITTPGGERVQQPGSQDWVSYLKTLTNDKGGANNSTLEYAKQYFTDFGGSVADFGAYVKALTGLDAIGGTRIIAKDDLRGAVKTDKKFPTDSTKTEYFNAAGKSLGKGQSGSAAYYALGAAPSEGNAYIYPNSSVNRGGVINDKLDFSTSLLAKNIKGDTTVDGLTYKTNGMVYKGKKFMGYWVYPLEGGYGYKSYSVGGPVQHFEPGGGVFGPGTGTSDSIPAYLSNGEYVIKADSVKKYGIDTFHALNEQKFAKGGLALKHGVPAFGGGDLITKIVAQVAKKAELAAAKAEALRLMKNGTHGSTNPNLATEIVSPLHYPPSDFNALGDFTHFSASPKYQEGSARYTANQYKPKLNINAIKSILRSKGFASASQMQNYGYTHGLNGARFTDEGIQAAIKDGFIGTKLITGNPEVDQFAPFFTGFNRHPLGQIVKKADGGYIPGFKNGGGFWSKFGRNAKATALMTSDLFGVTSAARILHDGFMGTRNGIISGFTNGYASPKPYKHMSTSEDWKTMGWTTAALLTGGLGKWAQLGLKGAALAKATSSAANTGFLGYGAVALKDGKRTVDTAYKSAGLKTTSWPGFIGLMGQTMYHDAYARANGRRNGGLILKHGYPALAGAGAVDEIVAAAARAAERKAAAAAAKKAAAEAAAAAREAAKNGTKPVEKIKTPSAVDIIASKLKAGPSLFKSNKKQLDQIIASIYKTHKIENDTNTYDVFSIGKDKNKFSFSGFENDPSIAYGSDIKEANLSGLSNIDKTIHVIPTTPQGIIQAALKLKPKNAALEKMLSNFRSKHYGPNENELMDLMSAAAYIDNAGAVSKNIETNNLAMVIAHLAGDAKATLILRSKKAILDKALRSSKMATKVDNNPKFDGQIDPSQIPIIHSTKYDLQTNKNGDFIVHPAGYYRVGEGQVPMDLATAENSPYPRSTVHTTAYGTVANHVYGAWSPNNNKLVSTAEAMVGANGKPYSFNPIDTWWARNPGQPLVFPKNKTVSIKTILGDSRYVAELIKRGIIKRGEHAPIIVKDPNSNEVLTLGKEKYSEQELQEVIDLMKPYKSNLVLEDGIIKEMQYSPLKSYAVQTGDVSNYIDQIATQFAKEKLGIDSGITTVDGWSLSSSRAQNHVAAYANKLGVGFLQHNGGWHSNIESMKYFDNPLDRGVHSGDFSENATLRFLALKGFFPTKTVKPKKRIGSDLGFWEEEDAKGGYISPENHIKRVLEQKFNIPQFKNGINMVPADMLAMIHKNEAVVPANMNPFNPNASNATMGGAVYNITNNINGANCDVNELSDVVTRRTIEAIKGIDKLNVKSVGQNRRLGSSLEVKQ